MDTNSNSNHPAGIPFGPDHARHTATREEAEHVLRGMYALDPDYFLALLVEVRLGRPLDLSAVTKARRTASKTADEPAP